MSARAALARAGSGSGCAPTSGSTGVAGTLGKRKHILGGHASQRQANTEIAPVASAYNDDDDDFECESRNGDVASSEHAPVVSEAGGYKLFLSSNSNTGYMRVSTDSDHSKSNRFRAFRIAHPKAGCFIGRYATAIEAAIQVSGSFSSCSPACLPACLFSGCSSYGPSSPLCPSAPPLRPCMTQLYPSVPCPPVPCPPVLYTSPHLPWPRLPLLATPSHGKPTKPTAHAHPSRHTCHSACLHLLLLKVICHGLRGRWQKMCVKGGYSSRHCR